MKPYIIHNTKRSDRRDSFLAEFFDQDINGYHLQNAILKFPDPVINIRLAHQSCVERNKEVPFTLIMEDDIKFLHKEAYQRFCSLFLDTPDDCDIFVAGFYDGKPKRISEEIAILEGKLSGLHCYFVRSKFYEQFLSIGCTIPFDTYLSTVSGAKIYAAYPMLAIQHDGFSDGENKVTNYNETHLKKYKLAGKL